MRRMKYKYCVAIAYLDTDTDDIKIKYIETLSYNANNAKAEAYEYISRFPNITQAQLVEVVRA